MGIGDTEFVGGVQDAFRLEDLEYQRLAAATKRFQELMEDERSNCVERAAAAKEASSPAPLWQRVCGFDPTIAADFEPAERRAGLRRLVRAVERMYRAELRKHREGAAGSASTESSASFSLSPSLLAGSAAAASEALIPGASRIGELIEPGVRSLDALEREGNHFLDGTRSYAGRSALFDPLPEICAYLGIAQRKLSELCRQQTGLRIHEVGDCIRAEKLTERLRERFRVLIREWHGALKETDADGLSNDWRGAAWRFVRWVRGRGRGESRKKLAWELGVATPARLGRAAFVCSHETLEELELKVALAALQELERAGQPRRMSFLDEDEEHGAQLSDVDSNGAEGADEVDKEMRDDGEDEVA